MKNIYIIRNVLYEWSGGMIVIIASDLKECRDLFKKQFVIDEEYDNCKMAEFDHSISVNTYDVFPVNDEETSRIVSYVYGSS